MRLIETLCETLWDIIKEMISHLYLLINKGYLAIPEKYDKLITSLRTPQAKEYSLDKEQTSYSDSLDA